MAPFDFRGIRLRTPDRTFDRTLTLDIGGQRLDLWHLGPAHTCGDTIIHVPEHDVVFAGDLLFTGVTPNSWSGTIDNWLRALDTIAALSPPRSCLATAPSAPPPTSSSWSGIGAGSRTAPPRTRYAELWAWSVCPAT